MEKPHATPTKPSNSSDPFRTIVLPAAGAITLIALFFTLLLSGPAKSVDEPATSELAADLAADAANATDATAEAAGGAIETRPVATSGACGVPSASGRAGVVSSRFSGRRTSSGHRYDPGEAACIINSAGALSALMNGDELRLTRADDQGLSATCRVVGHWNGERFPDRLVLVSTAMGETLSIGNLGLVDVASGCPGLEAVTARLR